MIFDIDQARKNLTTLSANRGANDLPDMETLRATMEELTKAQLSPPCIVARYLYEGVSLLIAEGGTGKTTLVLYEMIHIALGLDLWGRKIHQPGPTLLISAEDSREILLARMREIMIDLQLDRAQVWAVLEHVHIWDVAGQPMRLVEMDKMVELTNFGDQIIDHFKRSGLRMITFDPAISFGASEQAVNDNEQGLITAARRMSRGLRCCVRYVHHVSQAVARGKIADQYAGRGGTAMADGARMVTVLTRCSAGDLKDAPDGCGFYRAGDSVFTMTQAKLSFCPYVPKRWVHRRDFSFQYYNEPKAESPEEMLNQQMAQIERFLGEQLKRGNYLTRRNIERGYLDEVGMSRNQLEKVVVRLIATGRVTENKLLDALRRGGRQTFLCPRSTAQIIETERDSNQENIEP